MKIIRTGRTSLAENSSPASKKLHDLHHTHLFCGLRQGAHKTPVSVLCLRTNPCTGPYQLSSTSFKTNMIRQRSWDSDGGRDTFYSVMDRRILVTLLYTRKFPPFSEESKANDNSEVPIFLHVCQGSCATPWEPDNVLREDNHSVLQQGWAR